MSTDRYEITDDGTTITIAESSGIRSTIDPVDGQHLDDVVIGAIRQQSADIAERDAVIAACAGAVGASVSPGCSDEFRAMLPGEIRALVNQLRTDLAAAVAERDRIKGDHDEAAHFARHFIRDDPGITPRGAIIRLGDKCTDLFVRLQQAEARLAAAVAERDSIAIERDHARLTLREIAQILIEQIGSVGPENAVNAALRACEVIESMASRLSAIDSAPVVAWQDKSWRQDLYHRRPDPAQVDTRELIAKPEKD